MPQMTFAGHPLHPQLISAPLGLLPFSLAMDVMHMATGEKSYVDAAYYSMMGGYVGGLAAAAAGAMDYFTIPPETRSKTVANLHAALNAGVMGMYSLNLLLRSRGERRHVGTATFLLSLLGTAGLVAAEWYGGELVYELGMRVKPAMEGEEAPEARLPGDEKIAEGFRRMEKQFAPADGGKH